MRLSVASLRRVDKRDLTIQFVPQALTSSSRSGARASSASAVCPKETQGFTPILGFEDRSTGRFQDPPECLPEFWQRTR
jgi:hypothetical protein